MALSLFYAICINVIVSINFYSSFPINRELSCDILRQDGCHCMHVSENERLCCCIGSIVEDVPESLWRNVTKLIMKRVGITQILEDHFQLYTLLTHVEIIHAPNLLAIDAKAFTPLARLKKLSITDCLKLERVNGYLLQNNREMLTLEIKRTALSQMPKLKTVAKSLVPPNVDFSENEITSIDVGEAENILVSSLRLSNNRITYVAAYAFKNSKIFLLRLDNNPLTSISSRAFSGISALTKLDLSYSDIDVLPEEGLSTIEELSLEYTPNLKHLPPLIVFTHLKEARLTYPYHCCLFKYATTKDSTFQAKEYEGNLQELREKHCHTSTHTPTTITQSTNQLSISTTARPIERKMRNETKSMIDPILNIKTTEFYTETTASSLGQRSGPTENCNDNENCLHEEIDIDSDIAGGNILDYAYFGQHITRLKRNVMNQFGTFYDQENSQTSSNQQSDNSTGTPKYRQIDQAVNAITAFVWGHWQPTENDKIQKSDSKKRQPVWKKNPNDVIVWELEPVTVPTVVVPCADGGTAVHEFYANVKCTPQPDALNPCEDVMSGWHLRVLIFFVWLSAIIGNVLVLVVLFITKQPRQRVNNFLMINLAFADLCTGVYLAMLAVEDLRTKGEYYNFAVEWQTGWGCKIAGTLSIFASELSIVTMVMISFEVWYNTKYAIFQKRLSLSMVFPVMLVGWLFAGSMAILPLIDISDYSVTSTCLPLRLEHVKDQVYLLGCLSINVLAFAYIVYNYVSVYCMVAGSMAATTRLQDVALAKLMFCLIFTDFLCWAPTVFFGLTAASNMPLISISVAKIFLVLFYPLNAFMNPWLYVFLTKRFRKNMSRFIRKHAWLHELLSRALPQQRADVNGGNNYFYQSQPQSPTQATSLPSQRPSTCSSSLITPRDSISLPRPVSTPNMTESTSRSGSADSNSEIFLGLDNNLLNPTSGTGMIQPRRKSTTQRFRPQMSDIIEHSHSNSADDESHQQKIVQTSKRQRNTSLNLPVSISALLIRRRDGRNQEKVNDVMEMQYYNSSGLSLIKPEDGNRRNSEQSLYGQFPFTLPRDRPGSTNDSLESGYCTTTPLLTPDLSHY